MGHVSPGIFVEFLDLEAYFEVIGITVDFAISTRSIHASSIGRLHNIL